MICLHISRLISSILHRAKPETEMERSGIEVHVGVAKPETDAWILSEAELSLVGRHAEQMGCGI